MGIRTLLSVILASLTLLAPSTVNGDLTGVKASGQLRHLGVPYANFVTGAGDGMDVELMRRFATHLGVDYVYVPTTWADAIADLTGRKVRVTANEIAEIGDSPVRGDVIANGMTVIPWRTRVAAFATTTFPTQVWLLARSDSALRPIVPRKEVHQDIATTKDLLVGRSLLGKANTCLDPKLYAIAKTGARVRMFDGTLNELAPAVLSNEAELTLLDVPDALIALEKWPGAIKILGPISKRQQMAPAFRREDIDLRLAFNEFLAGFKSSGEFQRLVLKYYPFVSDYFPDFL